MKKLLVSLIEVYQTFFSFDKGMLSFLAPGGVCKNEVSCSEFTKQSIRGLGVVRGGLMGAKRIWSCR